MRTDLYLGKMYLYLCLHLYIYYTIVLRIKFPVQIIPHLVILAKNFFLEKPKIWIKKNISHQNFFAKKNSLSKVLYGV